MATSNAMLPTPITLADPGSTSSGSLTQGSALPNITTTQQQATSIPQFYQDYLNNITTQGGQNLSNMSYAGPTANQQAAFSGVQAAADAYKPGLAAAQNTVQGALGLSATGAAQPYVTQGLATSGLSQAQPYLNQAVSNNTGIAAFNPYAQSATASSGIQQANPYLQQATQASTKNSDQYMSPYTKNVVDQIGLLNQENIANTLSPAITSGAVGSGQFGSQRGAQALAMGISAADQNALAQQTAAQQAGYNASLQASQQQQANQLAAAQTAGNLTQQQNSLLGNLGTSAAGIQSQQSQNLANIGSTAGNLQQQQNQAYLGAAQTMGGLTNTQQANQLAGGQQQAAMANQAQTNALSGINALSTIGAQQQALDQAKINYPMTALQQYGSLLQGQTIPTATSGTYTGPIPGAYQSSPLATTLGTAATVTGILNTGANAANTINGLIK
jgi:hypothetical protein